MLGTLYFLLLEIYIYIYIINDINKKDMKRSASSPQFQTHDSMRMNWQESRFKEFISCTWTRLIEN